jgi:hypothetical protein
MYAQRNPEASRGAIKQKDVNIMNACYTPGLVKRQVNRIFRLYVLLSPEACLVLAYFAHHFIKARFQNKILNIKCVKFKISLWNEY